jgi:hypothetical protein
MPILSNSTTYSDSVLPDQRKLTAESISENFTPALNFRARDVPLEEAAGGFNCIIEVAASHSSSRFRSEVSLRGLYHELTGSRLQSFLNQHGHALPIFGHSPPIVNDASCWVDALCWLETQ